MEGHTCAMQGTGVWLPPPHYASAQYSSSRSHRQPRPGPGQWTQSPQPGTRPPAQAGGEGGGRGERVKAAAWQASTVSPQQGGSGCSTGHSSGVLRPRVRGRMEGWGLGLAVPPAHGEVLAGVWLWEEVDSSWFWEGAGLARPWVLPPPALLGAPGTAGRRANRTPVGKHTGYGSPGTAPRRSLGSLSREPLCMPSPPALSYPQLAPPGPGAWGRGAGPWGGCRGCLSSLTFAGS